MRRASVVQMVAIGIAVGAVAALVAVLVPWLPTSASREAGRIDFVIWFITVICIVIFAVVLAVILFSVVRFRARPDDDSDGPPIHGHTGLEIAWTAVPAVLVTAIAVISAIVLSKNGNAGVSPLRVEVIAQQFAWSFKYPQYGGLTSADLRLPVGRSTEFKISSLDVIHSFWVPEFRQKQDAVPGITTRIVVTPTRLGTYPVICTELCGLGHAVMRTQAIVMTPADFDAWAREQQQALAAPPGQKGTAVFANNGCSGCHTLAAAGATGKVGPDLDRLSASAEKAGRPLEAFVRESIVKPNAYIEPGYQPNVMPPTYATLPKDQLDALVQFLVTASEKGS